MALEAVIRLSPDIARHSPHTILGPSIDWSGVRGIGWAAPKFVKRNQTNKFALMLLPCFVLSQEIFNNFWPLGWKVAFLKLLVADAVMILFKTDQDNRRRSRCHEVVPWCLLGSIFLENGTQKN